MTLYLIETILGVFAVDEEANIQASITYPNDPKTIVKILGRLREGNASYISELVSELECVETIITSNIRLAESLGEPLNIEHGDTVKASNTFKAKLPELAVECGFIANPEEFFTFNYEVSREFTHSDVHDALSDREVLLIPAVQLLSDLDAILNSLSSRMREWYGVHFPEMGRRVRNHEDYANVILKLGDKENITADALMKMTLKKKDAVKVEDAAKDSMGASFDEFDIKTVQNYADRTLGMYKFREELIEYISTVTREVAPNTAYLAGPIIAAKLIDKAGGMKRLAMVPASTIQVLGAEKALFRAKKSNARPPKHGLLFQHPYVNSSPRDKRGSRARSLAAKIAIAARADMFSGDFIAEELAAQLADFRLVSSALSG